MDAVINCSDLVHCLGHYEGIIFFCEAGKNIEGRSRYFLKEVVSKEEGNEWVNSDDGIDRVENGSLDEHQRLEQMNHSEGFECFMSDLCMFLERRF